MQFFCLFWLPIQPEISCLHRQKQNKKVGGNVNKNSVSKGFKVLECPRIFVTFKNFVSNGLNPHILVTKDHNGKFEVKPISRRTSRRIHFL